MTNEEFIKSVTLDGEEWRDVVGYERLYIVSNLGRVAVLQRNVYRTYNCNHSTNPKLLKLSKSNIGYMRIGLTKGNKQVNYSVHRLVAQAFIPNPNKYPCIDHIDGNKENNCVENLRWCTQSQNSLNPITRKRNSLSKKGIRPKWACTSVVCLKNGILEKIYPAIKDTSRDGHIEQCVSRVCRWLRKTYHGYKWMYLSDYENLVNQNVKELLPN